MRHLWASAILLGLSGASMAVETPPAAGDSVYVAASFKGIQNPKLVSGAHMSYDMPPCKKLVVKKADHKKSKWVVEDALGNQEHLEGPWLPWMFTTEDECKSFTSTHGEASVVKSGTTFKVAENSSGAKK